jgi:predicted transcriptional regulator
MTSKFVPQTAQNPQPLETAEQREIRIRREMAVIAKAHAEIDAGLGIEDDDVEAWLDQLDIDENAPMPLPKSAARRP